MEKACSITLVENKWFKKQLGVIQVFVYLSLLGL